MPLWKIYHPEHAFTGEEKSAIAEHATALYQTFLARFYVNVMFVPLPASTFYNLCQARPRRKSGNLKISRHRTSPEQTSPWKQSHDITCSNPGTASIHQRPQGALGA